MVRREVLDELPEHPAGVSEAPKVLRVLGLVERPISLSPADLASLPAVQVTEDFVCEEGWRVPAQAWSGVAVGSLLDRAGVQRGGQWVEFAAADFRFSVRVEDARKGIVALSLNGKPLNHEHGGPARLFLPGGICFTSIKWLDRIEVRADEGPNTAEETARGRIAKR